MSKTYFEYRGVENAVYAEVLQDTAEAFITGPIKDFTGVSEIGKEVDSTQEVHYYDNLPAIVIDAAGSDAVSINASGIPLQIVGDITGQHYNANTGMLVEEEPTPKYFAFGYITNKTDGTKILVWRLKGKFSNPGTTAATKNNGTDANGQSITYTGISTIHVFTTTGKGARAVNIDTSINAAMTDAAFFSAVQTPDTIAGGDTSYTITFNMAGAPSIAAMDYAAGTNVTLPIPTYTGHTFEGWYLASDYSGSAVTTVAMTADVTVYAKWAEA